MRICGLIMYPSSRVCQGTSAVENTFPYIQLKTSNNDVWMESIQKRRINSVFGYTCQCLKMINPGSNEYVGSGSVRCNWCVFGSLSCENYSVVRRLKPSRTTGSASWFCVFLPREFQFHFHCQYNLSKMLNDWLIYLPV